MHTPRRLPLIILFRFAVKLIYGYIVFFSDVPIVSGSDLQDLVFPLVSEMEKPKVFPHKSRFSDKPFVSPSPSIRAHSFAHRLRSTSKSVRGNSYFIY